MSSEQGISYALNTFNRDWALVTAGALPASRVLLMTALRFAYGPTRALMQRSKRSLEKGRRRT